MQSNLPPPLLPPPGPARAAFLRVYAENLVSAGERAHDDAYCQALQHMHAALQALCAPPPAPRVKRARQAVEREEQEFCLSAAARVDEVLHFDTQRDALVLRARPLKKGQACEGTFFLDRSNFLGLCDRYAKDTRVHEARKYLLRALQAADNQAAAAAWAEELKK